MNEGRCLHLKKEKPFQDVGAANSGLLAWASAKKSKTIASERKMVKEEGGSKKLKCGRWSILSPFLRKHIHTPQKQRAAGCTLKELLCPAAVLFFRQQKMGGRQHKKVVKVGKVKWTLQIFGQL